MVKKSGSNAGKVLAVSIGIAAVSAAAYLLMGKNGKTNRKNLKGWMLKMKGEVVEKLEKMKEVTEEKFENVVSDISEKYRAMSHVDSDDLEKEVKLLRSDWKALVKKHKSGIRKVVKN
ncbi:MAG: YtxH domain-containing protein [Candidatus Pacebacteria bacterium]|nr:YtxH domain-containing protein [Candidatus Paceibacterota bacterium]